MIGTFAFGVTAALALGLSGLLVLRNVDRLPAALRLSPRSRRHLAQRSAQVDVADRGAAQLQAVSAAGFQIVPLLNAAAARLLPMIESVTLQCQPDHRVMAQTNLGELLCPTEAPDAEAAFAAICTKQLDFAIIDAEGMLVAAVECTDSHFRHGRTAMRDTIKREALKRAGVPLVDLPANANHDIVHRLLTAVLESRPLTIRHAVPQAPAAEAHDASSLTNGSLA